MNKYQFGKSKAREEAIEWQYSLGENGYSWYELCVAENYFTKLARRYGLVQEFRENGII